MTKLLTLKLANYRNHADTEIEFDPTRNVFFGPVGAGKTSIISALALCISGRNYLTDGRGTGMDTQITSVPSQAGAFKIRASFSDPDLTALRMKDFGGSHALITNVPNVGDSLSAQQQALLINMKLSAETLAALLDLRHILSNDREAQKEVLLKVLRPETFQLEPDILAIAKANGIMRPSSIEEVKAVYKQVYDERTSLKRKQKEISIPPQPSIPLDAIPDVSDLRTKLAVERSSYNDKLQTRAGMNAAVTAWNDAVGQRAENGSVPSEKDEADSARIVETLRLQLQAVENEVTGIQERGKQLERVKAMMKSKKGGKCPSCFQAISKEHAKLIEAEIAALAEPFRKKDEEAAGIRTQIIAAEAALSAIKKSRGAAALMAKLEPKAEKAAKQLPGLETEITELFKSIFAKEEAILSADQLISQHQQFTQATERARATVQKITDMERLVEYFGPKGVQAKMLESWCGPFVKSMSEKLAICGLKPLSIEFEPFRFMVGSIPADNLSEGQMLLFEACFRLTVAHLTGFGILVMDAASRFGPSSVQAKGISAMLDLYPDVQSIITVTGTTPDVAIEFIGTDHAKVFNISPDDTGQAVVDSEIISAKVTC